MYRNLISQFQQYSILVIGDLMLDVYLKGNSVRLAPEAPSPVVDILSSTMALGGAANTAANFKQLGAKVTFCGIAGKDRNAGKVIELLEDLGINSIVLKHSGRSTTTKTRVMSRNQLIVRYDTGSVDAIPQELEKRFISWLQEQYSNFDAIVIADYNKGFITPSVIHAIQQLNKLHRKFIAVDSKRLELFKELAPSLVKPNYQEAMQLLKLTPQYKARMQQVNHLGTEIFAHTGAEISVITLDEDGAVIFANDQSVYQCYARSTSSTYVAGAGDAYISAFTLSCLSEAGIQMAAELSAAAAAVAISKSATACCSWQELNAYLSINEKYITDPDQLAHLVAMYKAHGKKIVFTNGCFDILHSGHVSCLNRARELGQVLIVGINNDESIKRIKGLDRPINHLHDRIEVLSGLGAVNHIVSFGEEDDDTPVPLIRIIQPHFFAKGGDYIEEALPEKPVVEQFGGKVILLPILPERSTTNIIKQINTNHLLKFT